MNILFICNNYGSKKDGIGAYSKRIVEEISKLKNTNIIYLSENTTELDKIQRFFSLKMSKLMLKACKVLKNKQIDIINIEYPFVEWNPLIIFFYSILLHCAKKKHIKICFSIHEYNRSNFFRKKIIEFFVRKSDFYFITSIKGFEKLTQINNNFYIRSIPSNIENNGQIKFLSKNHKKIVFFGLINRNKAFDEMIAGWKKFYDTNNDYSLSIISSTDYKILSDNDGITFYHNADDKEISNIMKECTFAILPLIPAIDSINATLKTVSSFGCIPIGIFSKDLKEKKLGYEMQDYEIDSFYKVFSSLSTIDITELKDKMNLNIKFGKKYSFSENSKIILQTYIKEINKNGDKDGK